MRGTRANQSGGTLAFSVILIIVLIMIGVAFFAIMLYFGGAQETKDAVNSGTLNVAKKALGITVPLSGDPSQQWFSDISNSGQISLTNINRVWSKALFVGINADGAKQDGGHDGSMGTSAASACAAAQSISDALSAQLNTPNNLYSFFNDYAGANSVRMLGITAQVQTLPGADWKTSSLERTFESNIEFLNNLPVGYSNNALFTGTKRSPAPADAAGRQFLMGYSGLNVMGQSFWQVAFPFEQKPHLVDGKYFMNNSPVPLTSGGSSWTHPVPNAFGAAGTTKKSATYNETAVAWAETNPQQVFPMLIPHGYIRIVLKKNTLQWNPDGIPADSTDYGFTSDSSDSIPYPVGCGTMSGTAYVGNEYLLGTLYQGICAIPPFNGNALTYTLQRVQEMVPNYPMSKLVALLNTCFISTDDADQTFYIYPNSNNTDITVAADASANLPSGCDKSATAEGTEQTLDSEPPVPLPNFATEQFDCYGSYTFPTLCLLSGDRTWVPGTGWNGGCLGELRIHRTTNVYLFGVCPCP